MKPGDVGIVEFGVIVAKKVDVESVVIVTVGETRIGMVRISVLDTVSVLVLATVVDVVTSCVELIVVVFAAGVIITEGWLVSTAVAVRDKDKRWFVVPKQYTEVRTSLVMHSSYVVDKMEPYEAEVTGAHAAKGAKSTQALKIGGVKDFVMRTRCQK